MYICMYVCMYAVLLTVFREKMLFICIRRFSLTSYGHIQQFISFCLLCGSFLVGFCFLQMLNLNELYMLLNIIIPYVRHMASQNHVVIVVMLNNT